ncbi:unnamed protein product [[Actinomadura] parvosata subsp. kistnae]|uniref:hypothetical protein n=1 Tax=[Actinomadura] parvosata TaxID=1955412 RepID=UPI000D26A511|nr:unnamed protein product [Actinomadura parvosata subsp. kistnae]
MREHAGVSREELKHSAAVTVAVLLAVGLFAAWNVLIPGVDAWENIVAAVIGSLRLTGPVAAAFAAWVALRKRRALRGRSLTTWRALKAPLAIVMVVVGSFGATVLVLAVKTVLTDQAGRLSLTGLTMGMAGLALYSVIGWVAGWVLPRPFTPPLAGLACYGLFSWLADDRGWADKLAPGTGEPYDLFQGLNGAPFFDQTIWLLGITAALLLGWAALVTRQALVLACALLSVLAAGMGVSRVLAQPKPAAAVDIAYACQEWPITVCVHPGMRAGLTELGAAFTQIASRLAGTPAAFTRVEQRPLDDPLKPSNGLAPVHVPDLSAGFAEEAAHEYIEALAPGARAPSRRATGRSSSPGCAASRCPARRCPSTTTRRRRSPRGASTSAGSGCACSTATSRAAGCRARTSAAARRTRSSRRRPGRPPRPATPTRCTRGPPAACRPPPRPAARRRGTRRRACRAPAPRPASRAATGRRRLLPPTGGRPTRRV